MIQFVCDTCGSIKNPDEQWILGLAVENVALTAARREVTLLSAWDEARAREWFAVHFCSEQCKDDYMAQLFGQQPAQAEILSSVEVTSATGKKVIEMKRRQRTVPRRVTRRTKAK